MSKTSFTIALSAFSALALSAPAFATETVTWEQFVNQCENPKGSGDKQKQFEPEDIRVECQVTTKDFVELDPGKYDLPASAVVAATIVSKKQAVAQISAPGAAQSRTGECVRYKERERVVKFTQTLTCDDIKGIAHKGKGEKSEKGGDKTQPIGKPTDYCQDNTKGKGGKDRLVEEHYTGVERNSCPADARFGSDKNDDKKGDKKSI